MTFALYGQRPPSSTAVKLKYVEVHTQKHKGTYFCQKPKWLQRQVNNTFPNTLNNIGGAALTLGRRANP